MTGIPRFRLVAALLAALLALGALAPTPARAQIPEPPVQIIFGIASVGDLAAAAVLVNNRSTSHISVVDLRCVIDPNWTYVASWAGEIPGQNLGFPSLAILAGPDGQVLERPVITWINQGVPALSAQGPFIYVFKTNNLPGYTWCNGTFISGAFNRNITSDIFSYSP
jgi:hypothetical protein